MVRRPIIWQFWQVMLTNEHCRAFKVRILNCTKRECNLTQRNNTTTERGRLCPRRFCQTELWEENTAIMAPLSSEERCLRSPDGPQTLLSARSPRDHVTHPMTQGTQIRRGSTGLNTTLYVTPVAPFDEHASCSRIRLHRVTTGS